MAGKFHRRVTGAAIIVLCFTAQAAGRLRVRRITPADLPREIEATNGWLAAVNRDTNRRLREGELEHLVYYVLQSTRFTAAPPIEPAVSALAWRRSGARIPEDVTRRIEEFLRARPRDARHGYLRRLARGAATLRAAYSKAMDFLYRKEFEHADRPEAERRDLTARLYAARGHSTDTAVAAGYAVDTGLSILKALNPGIRARTVLIVGPGLDWAPRSGLRDEYPPQSYQPFAVADSLLRLGLAAADDLRIECIDINPRVVDYLLGFPGSARRLWIVAPDGPDELRAYAAGFGRAIGAVRQDGPARLVGVSARAAAAISAAPMNLLTERIEPAGRYDLAIATNVLLYFSGRELGLAAANLAAMIRPGGYLLHNDTRPEWEQWAGAVALPPVHARMLPAGPRLFDTAMLHVRK